MINSLPQSYCHGVMQSLLQALQAAPGLTGIPILYNPRKIDFGQSQYTIFLKDQADALIDTSSFDEKRRRQFVLGFLSRSATAEADVDALHECAVGVLKTLFIKAMRGKISGFSEASASFESETIDVECAMVLTNWSFVYVKNQPKI